ncbi:NAD/NADP transhydrogenase alpha subunit [Paenibacillus sp.]|uniref:NAD/NADP transhydrogenase alpha subunit n=1 Tax=Paenibacillus sp. TaxID=58172 RepID=UPI002D54CF6D|nr:NAD/NADP transhydrogenase alpha subunit [Paenibacillus sp.]HZG85316.1 NAD/NADP transhydrogenase alpha subunit [Paenibacillus sp.]
MKCISVYTNNFEQFSDIYDKVLNTKLAEDEETVVEGVTVMESGEVPEHYIDRMRAKRGVVVMKEKERDITILQHGEVFEILVPEAHEIKTASVQ